MSYIADRVDAVMAAHGESMVLTRASEGTTITLKGKRIPGSIEAVGNTDQQRFRVKIGTAELLASAWSVKAPSAGGSEAGDTLTVGGRIRNVLDVHPLDDGGTVAVYDLEVAG